MVYVGTAQNITRVTCSCVLNCLSFVFLTKVAREECSKSWKNIFYSVFSRLDPFPQVSGRLRSALYYNCMTW